jgi:hypothetical protein
MKGKLIMIIAAKMVVCLTLHSGEQIMAVDRLFPDTPELRVPDTCSDDPSVTHYLVENGVPKAQIIIARRAPTTVMLAARELQTAVLKMSGVNLPVRVSVDKDINFNVYVGRSPYTDSLGISSDGCRDGGYKMISGDNYLVLIGDDKEYKILGPHSTDWSSERDSPFLFHKWYELTGATWNNEYISALSRRYDKEWDLWAADGQGSFNAVNEFLYNQGVRWYYPGQIGEIMPKKQSIGFDEVCKTVNPEFRIRHFYILYMNYFGSDDDEILWQMRLRTNAQESYFAVPAGHGMRPVIDNDSMKKNHPEYYAVWDYRGGRQNGDRPAPNLCSEGLYQENLNYIKAIIDIYDERIISAMPTDGFNSISDDADPECAAWDTWYPGNYLGRLSDYVWEYENNLAWDIYNEYGSERKVSCSVYPAYRNVPTKLTKPPAPNLVASFVYSRADFYDEEYKKTERALLEDWLEFLPSDEFYVTTFYLENEVGSPLEAIPAIFPHIIAEDLRYLKGKSLGESLQIASSSYSSWDGGYDLYAGNSLNSYITARLYWDLDQDVDALLDEYYRLFYGPASQEMKAFHEYVEANYGHAAENPQIVRKMRNYLRDAKTAAGNTIYGERVDLLIELMDHEVRN